MCATLPSYLDAIMCSASKIRVFFFSFYLNTLLCYFFFIFDDPKVTQEAINKFLLQRVNIDLMLNALLIIYRYLTQSFFCEYTTL